MTNAIEIKNLTKKYPGFTLDNLSFALPSGCIMGFIGENGAGKSTAIKLILEIIHKDSGEIAVFGQSLSACPALKEQIGVVMDECGLPDGLTAKNISHIMAKCYKNWEPQKFLELIDRFDLPIKKKIKEYSKGMKMKLSIAVALSHGSKLLILDEATSGLDPIVREEILDIFLDFIQDENHSVLLSSHILSDLEKICDYITFIHKGKLIFSQPKDELLERYVVAKCSPEEYAEFDIAAVVGARKTNFCVEALAEKGRLPRTIATESATLEEIMLYFIKEDR